MSSRVTEDYRRQLHHQGYVVVRNALDVTSCVEPVIQEYADVLDRLASKLYDEGAIEKTYRDLPFEERLIRVVEESHVNPTIYFEITLPQRNINPDTPVHLGQGIFDLLTNRRLLDVVEAVIGPEISVHPSQHVRLKLPPRALDACSDATEEGGFSTLLGKSVWHQDAGTLLEGADQTDLLTVWVPLNTATTENGCLRVIPKADDSALLEHCPSSEVGAHIPAKQIEADHAEPLPMDPGDVLLLHPRTVHDSLPNITSDNVRLSLDLRYLPTGQPTGRDAFPSFVGRSRSHPELEMTDHQTWVDMWLKTRARLSEGELPNFNRWDPNSPVCA